MSVGKFEASGRWLAVLCAIQAVVIAVLVMRLFAGSADESLSHRRGENFDAQEVEGPVNSPRRSIAADAETKIESNQALREPPPAEVAPIASSAVPDPLGIVVYGSVLSEFGKPVERPWVTFKRNELAHQNAMSKDGTYSIFGLTPGTWNVTCRAPEFREATETVEIGVDTPVLRKDFVLRSSWILKVKFETPDGKSLIEELRESKRFPHSFELVIAVATPDAPGVRLPLTNLRSLANGSRGTFRLNEGPGARPNRVDAGYDGTLELADDVPVFVSAVARSEVLATERVTPGTDALTFVIAPEALTSRLVDVSLRIVDADSGAPLKGARVSLGDRQSGGGGSAPDDEGKVEFKDVVPGMYVLSVLTSDYEYFESYAYVESPGAVDLGTVRISPKTTISGVVVDSEGRPQGGNLSFFHADRVGDRMPMDFSHSSVQVANDGTFKIDGVGRGRYLLFPRSEGASQNPTVVDTTSGSVEDCRIVAVKGTPVEIDLRDGPEPPYVISIARQDGILVRSSMMYWRLPYRLNLLPGSYEVSTNGEPGSKRITRMDVGTERVKISIGK